MNKRRAVKKHGFARALRLAGVGVLATAALAFGAAVPSALAEGTGDVDLPAPAHEKSIKANDDGTYTISLNVTGSSNTSTESSKANVIVVLDTSGSMDDSVGQQDVYTQVSGELSTWRSYYVQDSETGEYKKISYRQYGDWWEFTYRWEYEDGTPYVGSGPYFSKGTENTSKREVANKAVSSLADAILTEKGNVQMSLVTFDTRAENASSYTGDPNEIKTMLPTNSDGGTNWEDAIQKAVDKANDDSSIPTYIVFVSDGDPTFRTNANGYKNDYNRRYGLYGSGSDDSGNRNYNAAVGVTKSLPSNVQKVFSVSCAPEASKMDDFAAAIAGGKGAYYDGNDPDKLNAAFENIAQEITKSATYQNVSIADTLSQWAEFTSATEGKVTDFTYTKQAEGEEATVWTDAPAATVEGSAVTWELKNADGTAYTLEDGVTYTVSFTVKPNQDAFNHAASDQAPTDRKYPSNASAFVKYDVAKKETGKDPVYIKNQDASYDQHPTMTVPASTLTINKVWNGEETKPKSIAVTIKQDGKDFKTVEVCPDANGHWTADVTVPAGSEHNYAIYEAEPGTGWINESYTSSVNGSQPQNSNSVTLPESLTAQTATFTVTNKRATLNLWVSKVDADNDNPLVGAKFNLLKDDGNGSYDGTEGAVTDAPVELADGYAKFTDLEPGTYWLKETYVPAGYQLAEHPYKVEVTSDSIKFATWNPDAEGNFGESETASQVENQERTYKVAFANSKVDALPSTGGIGNVPFYVIGSAAIVAAVVVLKRRAA